MDGRDRELLRLLERFFASVQIAGKERAQYKAGRLHLRLADTIPSASPPQLALSPPV